MTMTTPTTPYARAAVRAFIHPLLLATIACGGATGLGVVWTRTQIAATAQRAKQLRHHLDQTERTLAELNTALTAELAQLERRNAEWQLGLVPPSEPQLVRVAAQDEQRFAGRRAAGWSTDFATARPPATYVGRFAVNTPAR
jgi:hypothetical protein